MELKFDETYRYLNCTLKSVNNGSCRLTIKYSDRKPIEIDISSKMLPKWVKQGDRLEYRILRKDEGYIGEIRVPGVFENS